MAHDLMSQFYTCLNFPLDTKLQELTKIIDQTSPNKELQAIFPQLINNIFASSFSSGWGLRNITRETNPHEYEALIHFLEPQGPMFRLCYKLLSDPQLKYDLPLNILPVDLQMRLERVRCPQFYADLLATDSQTMNVIALMLRYTLLPKDQGDVLKRLELVEAAQFVLHLTTVVKWHGDPFDYYIFNFALHLVNNSQNKNSWENWNSVYFALACDYLLHFLPADPNTPVLPHIPNYTGKVTMAAPLQTANRPLYSPSLLLIPDMSGAVVSNQHSPPAQSRNEVWRSETVLQVFIDVWMSVEQLQNQNIDMYQRSFPVQFSSPERVRTVRVLVKHLHSFSSKHYSDPAVRSSALRKYARQIMCTRAYHYIKHLVTTWPLDASFRLVMELWLSLLQPWRYINNSISQDRFPNNNQEETGTHALDSNFTQFIAENFPSYTCIFQLVLPRFMRLDLTAYKNAIMLFRLGKVFSQPHLVPILMNLEQAIMDSGPGLSDTNFSRSFDQSYVYNGVPLHKWVAVAKQAITEMNLSANFEYQPIWNDEMRRIGTEFVRKILAAKVAAEKNIEEMTRRINSQHQGLWAGIAHWLMLTSHEDEMLLEDNKKVPTFLNTSFHYFTNIFNLSESSLIPNEPVIEDTSLENSSFANSSNFPMFITNRLRSKRTSVHYMGDPDLMPITSYESTILVRMLYQIASKLNELYQPKFTQLWNRHDFWGYVAREILQEPCRIQKYVKDAANYQHVVSEELPPRISLRKLGSQAFAIWLTIGYFVFKMFSYSGFFYVFILVTIWLIYVFIKVSLKIMRVL